MKKTLIACFLLFSSSVFAEEKVCISQADYDMALEKIEVIAEIMATSRSFIDQLVTLSAIRGSIAEGRAILDVIENIDSISNSLIKMTKTSLEEINDATYRAKVLTNLRKIQSSRSEFPTNTSIEFEGQLDQIISDLEESS